MSFSRRKFKISELVRLTDSFQQERKKYTGSLSVRFFMMNNHGWKGYEFKIYLQDDEKQ